MIEVNSNRENEELREKIADQAEQIEVFYIFIYLSKYKIFKIGFNIRNCSIKER